MLFKNLYREPTKDEYSIRSLPFNIEAEYVKNTPQESDALKDLQERVDRLRGRLAAIPVGEYNAIFGKVTQEGIHHIVVTYTLYHLNTL